MTFCTPTWPSRHVSENQELSEAKELAGFGIDDKLSQYEENSFIFMFSFAFTEKISDLVRIDVIF